MTSSSILTIAAECIREQMADLNKSEVSVLSGVPYPRIGYIMRNTGRMVRADDLEKLLNYFGYTITVSPPLAPWLPEGWKEHPDAPGWYYKGQEVKTKAQLKAMVATPVAAE